MSASLVFATISLHQMAGGLERNIIRIANHFALKGYKVSLLSFGLPDAVSFYAIDPNVTWHKLGRTLPHKKVSFYGRLQLLGRIRDALKLNSGGTVIVFHHGLLARLMAGGIGIRKRIICSERSALSMYEHIRAGKWNLNFFLMAFVSKIIVQFDNYKRHYPFFMRGKIVAIPNIVETASRHCETARPNSRNRFTVLAVGRLCDQKNYPALIGAFAKLAAKYPDWDLEIAGGGGMEAELKNLARQSGIEARVRFTGAIENIGDRYAESHIYAMPSKWEGFPNALAEAMAHGLPALGYKGCDGVADLIDDGKNGLLAEGNGDVESLCRKLDDLMSNDEVRIKMSEAARSSVASYSADKIYPRWENLFKDF